MLTLIASYPKSGNTWIRILFSNYFSEQSEPVDINALMGSPILSLRSRIDEEMGIDSSNMNDEELDRWRPDFCKSLARGLNEQTLIKVHDAYTTNDAGEPIFPASAISSVIYPYRNPLQICVSYAHHENKDIEWAVERITDPNASVYSNKNFYQQFRQQLFSWSDHVSSWIDQAQLPVLMVRYEQLQADPVAEFSNILDFFMQEVDEKRLIKAVEDSHISLLQKQESMQGFLEKTAEAKSFFRKGGEDDWQEKLSPDQIERIVNVHGAMMKRLGYELP